MGSRPGYATHQLGELGELGSHLGCRACLISRAPCCRSGSRGPGQVKWLSREKLQQSWDLNLDLSASGLRSPDLCRLPQRARSS